MTAAAYADKNKSKIITTGGQAVRYYSLSACRSERAAGNPAAVYPHYMKPTARERETVAQGVRKFHYMPHGFFGKQTTRPGLQIIGAGTPTDGQANNRTHCPTHKGCSKTPCNALKNKAPIFYRGKTLKAIYGAF